jgi:hypothetical protein
MEGGGLFLTNPGWLTAARDADREQAGYAMGSFLEVVEEEYAYSPFVPGGVLRVSYQVKPSLAVELGGGYSGRSWIIGGYYSSGTHPVDPSFYSTDYLFRIRLYPIILGTRYTAFENRRTALTLAAGVGIHITRMDYRKESENAFTSSWTGSYVQFRDKEESNGAGRTDIGAHFTVREEVSLSPALGLFLEAGAQIVPLGKMRGTTRAESRQYVDGELIYILEETRPNTWIEAAGASLSGLSIAAGIRVRLI